MPIIVEGQNYYRTSEACKRAGISKGTFFRWLKEGIVEDVSHADRRGWRLFTEDDISRIKAEASKVKTSIGLQNAPQPRTGRNQRARLRNQPQGGDP